MNDQPSGSTDVATAFSAEQAAAHVRFWAAAEEASRHRSVDLPSLRADLQVLGRTVAGFQQTVATIQAVRRSRAEADHAITAEREELARRLADQEAARAEVTQAKAHLAAVEDRLADANIAFHALSDLITDQARKKYRERGETAAAEETLRAYGFTGDLGAVAPRPEMVRVRAHGTCFIDNQLRKHGDVFETSADQIGGVVRPVDEPLGDDPEAQPSGRVPAPTWSTEGFKREALR